MGNTQNTMTYEKFEYLHSLDLWMRSMMHRGNPKYDHFIPWYTVPGYLSSEKAWDYLLLTLDFNNPIIEVMMDTNTPQGLICKWVEFKIDITDYPIKKKT